MKGETKERIKRCISVYSLTKYSERRRTGDIYSPQNLPPPEYKYAISSNLLIRLVLPTLVGSLAGPIGGLTGLVLGLGETCAEAALGYIDKDIDSVVPHY